MIAPLIPYNNTSGIIIRRLKMFEIIINFTYKFMTLSPLINPSSIELNAMNGRNTEIIFI